MGAVLCVALLASCSGGGTVPSPGTSGMTPHRRTGFIKARVFIPRPKRQSAREIQVLKARQLRHGRTPKFLSGNTTEIDFVLDSVSGVAASSQDRAAFDFIVYTTGNGCTISGGGLTCTIVAQAPAGADVYGVSSQQCSQPSGVGSACPSDDLSELGETTAPISVVFDRTVAAAFTLSPIVASIAWSAVGAAQYNNGSARGALSTGLWLAGTGPNAPVYSGGAYGCSNAGGCYEPVAPGIQAAYAVTLQAYDPSGALIVPASGGGTVYQTPVYLKNDASGNVDGITWACTDSVPGGTSLTWETGGGPFASNASATAANTTMNSPVANPAADADGGQTVDGNGSAVTAIGNNGVEMSWDGVDRPVLGSPNSCTAIDSEGNSASFYAGLSEGGLPSIANLFVADEGGPGTVTELVGAGGYTTANPLGSGYSISDPTGIAVDASGNVFFSDRNDGLVEEIPASGDYTTVRFISSAINQPYGLAVDASDNVFVVNASAVYEILASGGYDVVNQIGSGFVTPLGVAVDGSDNVYVTDENLVEEIPAAGGYATVRTLGSQLYGPWGIALDTSRNIYVTDTNTKAVYEMLAAGGYTTVNSLGSAFTEPRGVAVDGSGNVYVTDNIGNGFGAVDEIPVGGGVNLLNSGFSSPLGIAIGPTGDGVYLRRLRATRHAQTSR